MEYSKESFKKALKECEIIRWENHFEKVVKAYLKAEAEQLTIPDVVRSLPEHEVWTELSDKFREVAHQYKDGKFDYRYVWDWFQQQQKHYKLERQ